MSEDREIYYVAPTVVAVGSLAELTQANYPATGSDYLSFLDDGFGS